jgi:NAD-dependent dihydropyrimidine dehydrogenase PreA subunit
MAENWYPVIDRDICRECGACISMCGHGVYDRGAAPTPQVVNPVGCVDHCHGCGTRCPAGAITYFGEDTPWVPPKGKANQGETLTEKTDIHLGGKTMKKLKLFEPAMCCSTGLCGPSIDPELLRISTLIDDLKKAGVEVERFNLNSAPAAFAETETVKNMLAIRGTEALPITMLDDTVVLTDRYPTNAEVFGWLKLDDPQADAPDSDDDGDTGCGCGGGCCC